MGRERTTGASLVVTGGGRRYARPDHDRDPLADAVRVVGLGDGLGDGLTGPLGTLRGRRLRVKLGCDPTAPDLHLGHLVLLHRIRALQRLGHDPVLVVGDFTASIGDPTGRSAERPVLTDAQVADAAERFVGQMRRHVDEGVVVRRNSEWLDMPARELLGLARHVTMAQLLEREDFRARIDQGRPLSLTEVAYPLLQAYDSVVVEADLEIGGSDQLFNLMAARHLQRGLGRPPQAVVTFPLLVGLDGVRKMSKSLGNHVALDDPPADVYGKTMSIPDACVDQWCSLLLLDGRVGTDLPAMPRKRLLARSLVAMLSGADAVDAAEDDFDRVRRRDAPATMTTVEVDGLIHLPGVFSEALGVSRTQVRRWIGDGALRHDGVPVDAIDLDAADAVGEWRVGRRWVRLRPRS